MLGAFPVISNIDELAPVICTALLFLTVAVPIPILPSDKMRSLSIGAVASGLVWNVNAQAVFPAVAFSFMPRICPRYA